MKKYLITEQILVCYEVEANSRNEAQDKYAQLSVKEYKELLLEAYDTSNGDVNVEEIN